MDDEIVRISAKLVGFLELTGCGLFLDKELAVKIVAMAMNELRDARDNEPESLDNHALPR